MSNWISVEDEIPNDDEHVLLNLSYTSQEIDYDSGECIGDEKIETTIAIGCIRDGVIWIDFDDDFNFDLSDITHWMPLPEPPK